MRVIDYEKGISAIDSDYVRPNMDAIHLIVEGGRAAIVDTGTNHSVPHVLEALQAKGIAPQAVEFVILTHVHLDHAGGAGLLMQKLPAARLAVHPRGVRHMVDPAALMAGTIELYGRASAARLYGQIVPVSPGRILAVSEGSSLHLGDREFLFFDTPGHARHHVCMLDGATHHLFAGDMFGVSYREFDRGPRQFVFPATTPIQFDPRAFHQSIERLMALAPRALYITHYGQIKDVKRQSEDLLSLVDAHAELARNAAAIEEPGPRLEYLRKGVAEILVAQAYRQNWSMQGKALRRFMVMDINLNAAGLAAWLDTRTGLT